ncbi:uncharacterized protein LOC108678235 [Hyalella azteca]|uniref:Uncharacterized protein LOC108678235 n=1 Tax=Hyalella azteca TaxID=294128 RepID=A0A8B7P8F0_HYAAZ|nr:uncharacterized protein LOC108678235 [Hyalella azteca]
MALVSDLQKLAERYAVRPIWIEGQSVKPKLYASPKLPVLRAGIDFLNLQRPCTTDDWWNSRSRVYASTQHNRVTRLLDHSVSILRSRDEKSNVVKSFRSSVAGVMDLNNENMETVVIPRWNGNTSLQHCQLALHDIHVALEEVLATGGPQEKILPLVTVECPDVYTALDRPAVHFKPLFSTNFFKAIAPRTSELNENRVLVKVLPLLEKFCLVLMQLSDAALAANDLGSAYALLQTQFHVVKTITNLLRVKEEPPGNERKKLRGKDWPAPLVGIDSVYTHVTTNWMFAKCLISIYINAHACPDEDLDIHKKRFIEHHKKRCQTVCDELKPLLNQLQKIGCVDIAGSYKFSVEECIVKARDVIERLDIPDSFKRTKFFAQLMQFLKILRALQMPPNETSTTKESQLDRLRKVFANAHVLEQQLMEVDYLVNGDLRVAHHMNMANVFQRLAALTSPINPNVTMELARQYKIVRSRFKPVKQSPQDLQENCLLSLKNALALFDNENFHWETSSPAAKMSYIGVLQKAVVITTMIQLQSVDMNDDRGHMLILDTWRRIVRICEVEETLKAGGLQTNPGNVAETGPSKQAHAGIKNKIFEDLTGYSAKQIKIGGPSRTNVSLDESTTQKAIPGSTPSSSQQISVDKQKMDKGQSKTNVSLSEATTQPTTHGSSPSSSQQDSLQKLLHELLLIERKRDNLDFRGVKLFRRNSANGMGVCESVGLPKLIHPSDTLSSVGQPSGMHSQSESHDQPREPPYRAAGIQLSSPRNRHPSAYSDQLPSASSDQLPCASSDQQRYAPSDQLPSASSDQLRYASSDQLPCASSDQQRYASSDQQRYASQR